jgi:hypothetical protein
MVGDRDNNDDEAAGDAPWRRPASGLPPCLILILLNDFNNL